MGIRADDEGGTEMLTEREQKIEKLIDSNASHDNHYLVSNNQVRHFLFTIQHLREELKTSVNRWEHWMAESNQLEEDKLNLERERDKLKQENEQLRGALEDIAFGRVEGDYSDARQYASEALEEEKK
jgi:hypothetical protein